MSIREQAEKEVHLLINEDRTISNIVTTITEYVGGRIEEMVKRTPSDVRTKGNNISIKRGNFVYTDLGISFMVKWVLEDEHDKDAVYSKRKCSAYIEYSPPRLNITIAALNGRFSRNDLYETLQHEISHFFERGKRGKEYKTTRNYAMAVDRMNNGQSIKEKVVARAVYICHKFELRAFANGAYQYLMKSTDYGNGFRNSIEHTRLYDWLIGAEEMQMFLSQYIDYPEQIEPFTKKYGFTLNRLLKMLKRTIDAMVRTVGRVISKAMDDYEKIHGVHQRKDMMSINELAMSELKLIDTCRAHFRPHKNMR